MSGRPADRAHIGGDQGNITLMHYLQSCALFVSLGCSAPATTAIVDGKPGKELDAAGPGDAALAGHMVAYVGGDGASITRYDIADSGGLTAAVATSAFAASPSFLAITRSALYAVSESASRIGAYARDPATGALALINDAAAGGNGPAYLGVDRSGAYVLVANYGDGSVATLAIRGDGGVAAPRKLAVGIKAHMIVTDPSNRYAFVPCLGSDYVAQFTFDAATGTLAPNQVPYLMTAAGAGPRHLAFAPDGHHAYLINELASTLSALAFDPATGRLAELQTVSTRAAGATGDNTGAEVAVHPSGAFVYASNRGDDTIAVFAVAGDGTLTRTGQAPVLGRTPRQFAIDLTGSRLYVANQDSSSIVPFALDPRTGIPAPIAAPVTVASPTFVGIVALAR